MINKITPNIQTLAMDELLSREKILNDNFSFMGNIRENRINMDKPGV